MIHTSFHEPLHYFKNSTRYSMDELLYWLDLYYPLFLQFEYIEFESDIDEDFPAPFKFKYLYIQIKEAYTKLRIYPNILGAKLQEIKSITKKIAYGTHYNLIEVLLTDDEMSVLINWLNANWYVDWTITSDNATSLIEYENIKDIASNLKIYTLYCKDDYIYLIDNEHKQTLDFISIFRYFWSSIESLQRNNY